MFRTRLLLVNIVLILFMLFMACLAHWAAEQFKYHLVRSQMAHNVNADYLRLSAQTYTLFKQFMDFVITDEWNHNNAESLRLRQDIEATLDRIRLAIAGELAHVGNREEEAQELKLLARIEQQLQLILSEFEAVSQLKEAGQTQEAKARVTIILENSIDRTFKDLINEALQEENQEVMQTDRAASAVLQRLDYAMAASFTVAVMLGLGSTLLLRRRLHGPLSNLMQGTQALADGNLAYRMPVTGHDEFARIAARFNQMAEEIESHRRQLEQSQVSLEQTVVERTHQLQLANEALNRADQVRRQFFADISHELRTPLTVIRGESQFALRGTDKTPEEYKDTLQRICTQAEQLGRLVNDLLFIARSDGGVARLERTAVALDKLVGQVCADGQTLASRKGITIEFRSAVAEAVVSGDQGRLQQVFLILLDNAISYSEPGSQVDVTIDSSPRGVSVQISDSGIGLSADELGMVFERFYRGDRAAAMHSEGLGLGLPVAKAIVEAHGGHIAIASRSERGATVTVTLPVVHKLRVAA